MNLSKSKIFLILCLGFIGGVFVGKFLNFQIMAISAMIFVIIGSISWKNKTIVIICVAGLVGLTGTARYKVNLQQNDLSQFYNQKVSGEGIISEEPDVRADKTFLTVDKIIINGQNLDSKILFNTGRFPEYQYGERIAFEAKLLKPQDAESPGEFSYRNYLSRFGIDAIVYYPKIQVLQEKQANPVKFYLSRFKQFFISRLSQLLPEPQNAFLGGLLVGLRRAIPTDLTEALSVTGTTHIIAISGFNITIIAWAINVFLLKFFNRRISFVIALLAITLFVILTGASSSAVRAGIMGALGMIALRVGRLNVITNALVFTAALMLAVNPQILRFDAGFQLSFLALLGLVYLSPIIETLFSRIPKMLRNYLVPTISAYIFTLPILLYSFGRLSLVAIPVNVLVLPVVPIAMLFGFITGALALIWPPLANSVVWLTWGCLTYILEIISLAARLPFAAVGLHIGAVWVFVIYLILSVFILYKNYPDRFQFKKIWKKKPAIFSNI